MDFNRASWVKGIYQPEEFKERESEFPMYAKVVVLQDFTDDVIPIQEGVMNKNCVYQKEISGNGGDYEWVLYYTPKENSVIKIHETGQMMKYSGGSWQSNGEYKSEQRYIKKNDNFDNNNGRYRYKYQHDKAEGLKNNVNDLNVSYDEKLNFRFKTFDLKIQAHYDALSIFYRDKVTNFKKTYYLNKDTILDILDKLIEMDKAGRIERGDDFDEYSQQG